jgi:hypothetical protein
MVPTKEGRSDRYNSGQIKYANGISNRRIPDTMNI